MSNLQTFSLKLFRGIFALLSLCLAANAASANMSFDLRTGNNSSRTQKLTSDSNQCPAEGPLAAYVGGIIRNDSTSRITGASATINGLNSNVFLAGGQPASQFIGALEPGQSIAVYWFVGYGCAFGSGATPTISMTSSAGSQSATLNLVITESISANAGGQLVGSSLGSGAVVGQRVYFDARYDFGGSDRGDEFILQPTSQQDFNAACFRLVGSEVIGSNVAALPVGLTNRLYRVQNSKQSGNSYFVNVRYFFEYRCANTSTTAKPYAVQTSGTRLKYTGNNEASGGVEISFPGATNPFTITKSVSETRAFVGSPGNLTYTVTISNPSVHDTILDRITDTLPSGMTFVAIEAGSDVVVANSSEVPPAGSTGTLNFIGTRGNSYLIRAGSSLRLIYTVSRPGFAGTFVNSAQGVFGQATTALAQASYSQFEFTPIGTTKVSSVVSDPKNGSTNPFAIPEAVVEYTIGVFNPNSAALDQDSVVVTDFSSEGASLCLLALDGPGPISFVDGDPASGLSFTYETVSSTNDDVEFTANRGASWDYAPTPDSDGCDPAVNGFRIRMRGAFAGSSNFNLKIRYRLQ